MDDFDEKNSRKAACPLFSPYRTTSARRSAASTVVITCGNPWSMEDLKYAAETSGMKFEKEDW